MNNCDFVYTVHWLYNITAVSQRGTQNKITFFRHNFFKNSVNENVMYILGNNIHVPVFITTQKLLNTLKRYTIFQYCKKLLFVRLYSVDLKTTIIFKKLIRDSQELNKRSLMT